MHCTLEKNRSQSKHCKHGFVTKDRLKKHEQIHSNEKLFSCKLCVKKFKQKNGLKQHEQIHNKEKSYIILKHEIHVNHKWMIAII